jgi:hypothetical protein
MTNLGGDDEKRRRASLETQANFNMVKRALIFAAEAELASKAVCRVINSLTSGKKRGQNINPLSGTWQM